MNDRRHIIGASIAEQPAVLIGGVGVQRQGSGKLQKWSVVAVLERAFGKPGEALLIDEEEGQQIHRRAQLKILEVSSHARRR